jgi:hypothetical protein
MRSLASSLFFVGLFLSPSAFAATVESVQGPVSFNHGEGFRQVAGTTAAAVGDKVMAGPGGSASIVYPDGCAVTVNPGAVVTIQEPSPCKAGFINNLAPFAVGTAIVAGAFVISTLNNENNNNNKPASP